MKLLIMLTGIYSISVFGSADISKDIAKQEKKLRGLDCLKHKIFCQIVTNSPRIETKKAMEISNIIYKSALKHNIPSKIYTAILMQESGYRLQARGCSNGLAMGSDGIIVKSYTGSREIRVCSDFGMSQIHYRTADSYGLDIERLTADLQYSIDAGAKVLSYFKNRYQKKEPFSWWTRYNCGTKSNTLRKTCQIYKTLVERYL